MYPSVQVLLRVIVIGMSLFIGAYAYGEPPNSYLEQVRQCLEELDREKMDENWFYTMTTVTKDEILVTHSNPLRDKNKRVKLISVNDKTPSADRRKAFKKEEANRLERESEKGGQLRYSEMVDLDTLKFKTLNENNKTVQLSFSPRLKDMEDERDKFIGSLTFNTVTGLIETLAIENTEKVSPAFSVSIHRYKMTLDFVSRNNSLLIGQLKSTVKGKVGFLKTIDVDVDIIFSDYRKKPNVQEYASE